MIFTTFRVICTFLLSIILFIAFPLAMIISSPIFFTRFLIAKSAKYFRPDLQKMVTARSNLFTTDDLHNQPKCSCVVSAFLQGNVDIDKARVTITNAMEAEKLSNGDPKYPEFKQYLTSWAGFYFWKSVKNFEWMNQIKILETSPISDNKPKVTDEDIQKIRQQMLEKPWDRKAALWEINFITNCYPTNRFDNYEGPYTALVFRFHHSLGDGYAFKYIIYNGFFKQPKEKVLFKYPKRSFLTQLMYAVAFPFRASYNMAELSIISLQKHPFRVTATGGRLVSSFSNRIPIQKLIEIKIKNGVTLSSVVTCVIAGALRDILIKKKLQIPSIFPTPIPFPLPGHSLKLRNYMTVGVVNLPTGLSDPIARLKYCYKDYIGMKGSPTPGILKYTLKISGSYCIWLIKFFEKRLVYSVTLSNFPGGTEHVWFNGHRLEDPIFCTGLPDKIVGLGFFIVSYTDSFRFAAVADDGVLTQDDVNEIGGFIEKHVDILLNNNAAIEV